MTGIVFAAIAPHGSLAVPELSPASAAETQAAMTELGERFRAARPDATVVLTPHGVHVEGSLSVVVAGSLAGSLDEEGRRVELAAPVDRGLAGAILDELRIAGIPTAAVTFGTSDPAEAEMPMDWGTLIPLWFMGGGDLPVVVVSTSVGRSPEEHVRAGHALAFAAAQSGKRVALIASADHGHAHDADGPYGFDPAASEYDRLVVEAVRANRLGDLLAIDEELVRAARADSFRQLLVLHGACGGGCDVELLSYEAPTYYGMLCAALAPQAA
jgi:aromatic ring-opening dioxygenase LigB subunit